MSHVERQLGLSLSEFNITHFYGKKILQRAAVDKTNMQTKNEQRC